jgi:hypothetical protein
MWEGSYETFPLLKYGAGVAIAADCDADADAMLLEEARVAHAVDDASCQDNPFTLDIWTKRARIPRRAWAMTFEW